MQLLQKIGKKLLGDPNKKVLAAYAPKLTAINALEAEYEALSDEALKEKTVAFKQRLSEGSSLDDLLVEAFAVVREASKRTLKMRHFDVQLIGGIVLHEGRITEMKTGEGKTLVSTLAAYLNALLEKGVYIVTVNDYLAKRDSEWMGEIYAFLGLSVGLIQANISPEDRIAAYACDITYGTNNEYGFDYLRDNLALHSEECCQTRRHFAIIDEVDSILIDEARTPLIISGPIPDSTAKYRKIVRIIKSLEMPLDFTCDEKQKNIILTDSGTEKIEKEFKISNIYSTEHMELAHMAVQCLKAKHLFKRDVDYVVKDGSVMIVDEFTGRILDGRRYSDGLHQAIEALENLSIKEESQTLASVTYQNYFRLFPKLAGMTGTAVTEEEEFIKIYSLSVVAIPTNKPINRTDRPDIIYKSKKEKFSAIAKEIKEKHSHGQPILVGTISIESSEYLATLLKRQGVPHKVLNAKHHEKEADIIANAGKKGSVTIATNMAGRGTDIVLGEGVTDLGGLYVIGSERHESRRIDNQLRGRSGRQGDPGASKFYVALDDDLMRLFGSDRIASIMERLGLPDDTPIEHALVSRSIGKAQKKVEQHHFAIRKQILEYDNIMDKQRETVYALRRDFLGHDALNEKVKDAVTTLVKGLTFTFNYTYTEKSTHMLNDFTSALQNIFPIANMAEMVRSCHGQENHAIATLSQQIYEVYITHQEKYPKDIFSEAIKVVFLRSLDARWMDHLHNMDILREGIGLRAYGQRDPLIEYKVEAFEMFKDLLFSVYEESMRVLMRIEIFNEDNTPIGTPDKIYTAPHRTELTPHKKGPQKNIGRNDTCHCGSKKKYKKCCMN